MSACGTTAGTIPILSSRTARVGLWLALLAASLLVSAPAYTGLPSRGLVLAYRFGFPVLWGGLALMTTIVARLRPARPVLLSLFGVSLGLALAYLVGDWPIHRLGLSVSTPRGAAVAKLSEATPICAAILLAALLANRGFGQLALRRGRLGLGLGLGLLFALPLVAFAFLVPGLGMDKLWSRPLATVLSWLPWIVLFSIANGFMEELWFRGSWFGTFSDLLGPTASMHLTSMAFAVWHVIIYWSQPVALVALSPVFLYLGYACCHNVRKTGSLWGAVLTHVIADVLFVLGAFAGGAL